MKSKKNICPFCHSTDILDFNDSDMNYSSNLKKSKLYSCLNCGCAFNGDENLDNWQPPTEISKKEFFNIILEAINDVFGPFDDLDDQRKRLEEMYEGIVKTYYKEIAILQAEAFYEADSEYERDLFIKEINKSLN